MREFTPEVLAQAMAGAQGPSTADVRKTLSDTIVDRGMILPLATNALGETKLAAPGAWEAWKRMVDRGYSPGDDEARDANARDALEVAGAAFAGGMPFAASNAAGIFGGRLAKTADFDKLNRSYEMRNAGADERDIFDKTGWFRGVDRMDRFEIPDDGARFKVAPPGTGRPASSFIDHPALFAAYPELAGMKMYSHAKSGEGEYNPFGKHITLSADPVREMIGIWPHSRKAKTEYVGDRIMPANQSVSLHELQHAVQHIEGFSSGNNPMNMLKRLGGDPGLASVAFEAYRRVPGEVEARNVEKRWNEANRTGGYGNLLYPWQTQDRSEADQIMAMGLAYGTVSPSQYLARAMK